MSTSREKFIAFVSSEGAILDAGCGTGDDTGSFATSGFEAVGIDIDAAKLEQARSRIDQCIFRQMDARSLRYPTACFDGVWADRLLDQLTQAEAQQTISGFARVLKPGAPLYLTTEKYRADYWIRDCGFKIASETDSQLLREIIALRNEDVVSKSDQQFEEDCFLC